MIELNHVFLEYDNFSLKDINFKIQANDTVTIIGQSGSGKSSLVALLCGLQKPSSGSVCINGSILNGVSRDVAIILQDYALLPWKNVYDNIAFVLKHRGVEGYEQKVRTICQEIGIENLIKRYPLSLSGGEKQRVAIARSLVLSPKVLILDEAFSALDSMNKERLETLIVEYAQKMGITVIMITHNIEEAVSMGDRILVMSQGEIVHDIDNRDRKNASVVQRYEMIETLKGILKDA